MFENMGVIWKSNRHAALRDLTGRDVVETRERTGKAPAERFCAAEGEKRRGKGPKKKLMTRTRMPVQGPRVPGGEASRTADGCSHLWRPGRRQRLVSVWARWKMAQIFSREERGAEIVARPLSTALSVPPRVCDLRLQFVCYFSH